MIQSPIGHRNASFRDWAPPPWTCHSPEWLAIDAKLPADHLARHITKVVERLELTALYQTYSGRGSLAHRPDLMLKVVLYEMQRGRHRPSQWAEDFIDSRAVSWLALGMQVSRTRCYAFRDRLTPLLDGWQQQLLHQAIDFKLTPASRSALDGSSVAANATRHQLINRDTLNQRLAVLESVMGADACDDGRRLSPLASESVEPVRTTSRPPPAAEAGALGERPAAWLAPTERGRQQQYERYQKSQVEFEQRHEQNQQRAADKRQPADKVMLSLGDPEAPLGRDKEKVYRPLYNVQFSLDLDSPLILAYDVFAQPTDAGTLGPMLERQRLLTGRLPKHQLGDASYATALDLAVCHGLGVELYAPYQENDFSANGKKSAPKQTPKSAFTWLEAQQTYQCPQGHLLNRDSREHQRRAGGQRLEVVTYRCAATLCMACEQQKACVQNPQSGRTVKRSEYEHFVEELQARMATDEAKALYKLRKQTVELSFADLKAHRELRRFSGKGLSRARTEVGLLVLAHNGLTVVRALETPSKLAA